MPAKISSRSLLRFLLVSLVTPAHAWEWPGWAQKVGSWFKGATHTVAEAYENTRQWVAGTYPALGDNGYCFAPNRINAKVWQEAAILDPTDTVKLPSRKHWSPDWTYQDPKDMYLLQKWHFIKVGPRWEGKQSDFTDEQWQNQCTTFYTGFLRYPHLSWKLGKGCCEPCGEAWTPWGRECRVGLTCHKGPNDAQAVCVGEGWMGSGLRRVGNFYKYFTPVACGFLGMCGE